MRLAPSGVGHFVRLLAGMLVLTLLAPHTAAGQETGGSLRDLGEALKERSADAAPGSGYAVLSEAVDRAIGYIEDLERERSVLRAELASLDRALAEAVRERDEATSSGAEVLLTLREREEKVAQLMQELETVRERLRATERAADAARAEAEERVAELRSEMEASRMRLAEAAEAARLEAEDKAESIAALEAKRDEALAAASGAEEKIAELDTIIARLRAELETVTTKLAESELEVTVRQQQVEELGLRLAEALQSKVEELERYRSEFFGRLRTVLEGRQGVRVSGDRFTFQSEVLFSSGSATLGAEGRRQLAEIAGILLEITPDIPDSINWILQVEGHTDDVPIVNAPFASNWELSTARALSVVRELIALGLPPEHLAATGYGEFQPVDPGGDEIALRRNRRIELKLTQR